MTRLLIGVLLLCGVACKAKLEDVAFDQRETLPGFTISLPTGKRVKSELAPAAGQIIVDKDGAVLTIGWQAGRMPKEDLAVIAVGIQGAIGGGAKAEVPEATDVDVAAPSYGSEFMIPTDKRVFLGISVVQCMASNVTVTIATMADPELERARAFHRRLVATLQCGDLASATTPDRGLPAFDQGETIGYLPDSDPPAYFSLTGARWYVTPGVPSMRAAFERPEAVAALLGGLGMEVVEQTKLPAEPGWLHVQLKVRVEGELGFMLAGVLVCGESAFTVMHVKGDMGLPEPAELQRVRCPQAVVDPATLPTVADRFGRACETGDAVACEVLAMLADEEPKLLPGQDAKKLRARGCELGSAHLCAGG